MRILLIEDGKRLSNVIKKGFTEQGFAVDQAFDGEEGLFLATSESYDVVILDWMLPKMDGVALCQDLRKQNISVPVIMLTAKTQLHDKVSGLNAGADDYLIKPFEFAELQARVNALMRRNYKQLQSLMIIDNLEIDPIQHIVKRNGHIITLTPKEFAILELLARQPEGVVTRTQIIEHTWDYNFDNLSNVVDVFIAGLRKKIDNGYKKKLIHTIHGIGYKMSDKGKQE